MSKKKPMTNVERQRAFRERQKKAHKGRVELYLSWTQKRALTSALTLLGEDLTRSPEVYSHLAESLAEVQELIDQWVTGNSGTCPPLSTSSAKPPKAPRKKRVNSEGITGNERNLELDLVSGNEKESSTLSTGPAAPPQKGVQSEG